MDINLQFIKKTRENKSITLVEMAELFNFKNASTYLKYENGLYSFKANMLPLLAEKLECKISDFFYN